MTIQPVSNIQPIPVVQPVQEALTKEFLAQNKPHEQSRQDFSEIDDKEALLKKEDQSINDLHETVNQLNERLLGRDMKMQFKIHQRTGYTVVKLVDMQTGDVVKEIPPENMLNVLGKIWDDMGIAIDRKG